MMFLFVWFIVNFLFWCVCVPRRYFFCESFMFLLSCVCYAFVRVCLFVPCRPLLGKGWSLGSRLCCITVGLSLSHWYPGSGVVLDCIDYWSLHPYLLWLTALTVCELRALFFVSSGYVIDLIKHEKHGYIMLTFFWLWNWIQTIRCYSIWPLRTEHKI